MRARLTAYSSGCLVGLTFEILDYYRRNAVKELCVIIKEMVKPNLKLLNINLKNMPKG